MSRQWTGMRGTLAAIAGFLAMVAAGCAGLRRSEQPALSATASQEVRRRQEVVRQFEMARNQAECQAAAGFLQQGNNQACRQSIERLLQRNPSHHDGRLLFADLLIEEQNFDGAEKQLRDVLATSGGDAAAEHALALVLDAKGQTAEAQAHYARAARLMPKNEAYRLSCQLAAGAAQGGPAPAVAARSKSQVVQASAIEVLQGGMLKGKSPKDGASDEGESAGAMFARLEAAIGEGEAAKIREVVDEIAAVAPSSPQNRLKAAVIALRHERAELAAEIATAASVRFPKSAEAFRILGTAKYRLRDYRAAQDALATALALDNSSALACFLMGCTVDKLGEPEAATSLFARAAELDPRFAKTAQQP